VKSSAFSIIKNDFFYRPTLEVARDLIDKYLITNRSGVLCGGKIVETEAYVGREDRASHAWPGITERNKVMYGKPGYIYVYLIYGIHYCFNVVCEKDGVPGAVLIRAIEPEIGIEEMKKRRNKDKLTDLASGPAKLAQALKIAKDDNEKSLPRSDICFFESGEKQRGIVCGPRIGITKAAHLDYRFFVKDNKYVSRI
jgi:DNA-3-methyladenine glycosylase